MAKKHTKSSTESTDWLDSQKKRPARKASSSKATMKRFKQNTVKVKTTGKKTKKTAKIKM